MSIYFIHLFSELFILSYFAAFINKKISTQYLCIAAFIGLIFGYFAYFIFDYEKLIRMGIVSANVLLIISLLAFLFSKFKPIALIALACLSASLFMRYFFKSKDFPIFESSLLDTSGILNFAFILLAFVICFIFFITFRFIIVHTKIIFSRIVAFLLALLGICAALGEYLLYLIRVGVIEDSEGYVLSFSAKAAYYESFYCYVFLIIGILLALSALKNRPAYKEPIGNFDINYRLDVHKINSINAHVVWHFIISVAALCVSLYFYLVASKPIEIDPPKIITPNTEKYFTFKLDEVTDGHLHRYAYINSTGKKIRWFIINRFPGKITPVAVFDSCMICGDLGYVEKEGELMCVACNVRIFIPSVGKAGGCNPIPIEQYEIDEENGLFKIPIKEINAGENYFSEVVEVSVKDPVNGTKFLNTQASRSYLYRGVNYYFASEETYKEFKADPDKYAPKDASARYRLKG